MKSLEELNYSRNVKQLALYTVPSGTDYQIDTLAGLLDWYDKTGNLERIHAAGCLLNYLLCTGKLQSSELNATLICNALMAENIPYEEYSFDYFKPADFKPSDSSFYYLFGVFMINKNIQFSDLTMDYWTQYFNYSFTTNHSILYEYGYQFAMSADMHPWKYGYLESKPHDIDLYKYSALDIRERLQLDCWRW